MVIPKQELKYSFDEKGSLDGSQQILAFFEEGSTTGTLVRVCFGYHGFEVPVPSKIDEHHFRVGVATSKLPENSRNWVTCSGLCTNVQIEKEFEEGDFLKYKKGELVKATKMNGDFVFGYIYDKKPNNMYSVFLFPDYVREDNDTDGTDNTDTAVVENNSKRKRRNSTELDK